MQVLADRDLRVPPRDVNLPRYSMAVSSLAACRNDGAASRINPPAREVGQTNNQIRLESPESKEPSKKIGPRGCLRQGAIPTYFRGTKQTRRSGAAQGMQTRSHGLTGHLVILLGTLSVSRERHPRN